MKRQRVHQDVIAGPVVPGQREEPAVDEIRGAHEAVDDAQCGARSVVMAPVLCAHHVVGLQRAPAAAHRGVDRCEATGERDVVDPAACKPLRALTGWPRRHPGQFGGCGERLDRILRRRQLGVEGEVAALGARSGIAQRSGDNGRRHRGGQHRRDPGAQRQVADRRCLDHHPLTGRQRGTWGQSAVAGRYSSARVARNIRNRKVTIDRIGVGRHGPMLSGWASRQRIFGYGVDKEDGHVGSRCVPGVR